MDINLLSLTVDWILPFSTWAMWLINVLHPLSFLYWSPNWTPFFFCNSHRLANLLKAISSCATKKDVLSRHWSAEKNFSLIWTTFLWTAALIGSTYWGFVDLQRLDTFYIWNNTPYLGSHHVLPTGRCPSFLTCEFLLRKVICFTLAKT